MPLKAYFLSNVFNLMGRLIQMNHKKWIKFLIGIGCLSVLFFILPVLHGYIPGSKNLQHIIKKENIDIDALFYSEESRSAGSKKAIEEKLETLQKLREK